MVRVVEVMVSVVVSTFRQQTQKPHIIFHPFRSAVSELLPCPTYCFSTKLASGKNKTKAQAPSRENSHLLFCFLTFVPTKNNLHFFLLFSFLTFFYYSYIQKVACAVSVALTQLINT